MNEWYPKRALVQYRIEIGKVHALFNSFTELDTRIHCNEDMKPMVSFNFTCITLINWSNLNNKWLQIVDASSCPVRPVTPSMLGQ